MATYETFNEARTAYLAAVDWETSRNVAKAQQTVDAINAMFAFAVAAGQGGGGGTQNFQFDFQRLVEVKEKALTFIRSHSTVSDSELMRDPAVTHVDFSGFHRY